jgi:ubiquitin carboxyl-terminal hydrolase 4/11
MESDRSSSSNKRMVTDAGSQDLRARSPKVDQMSTLSLADSNRDIDVYMAEQGEEDLEKGTISQPPQEAEENKLEPTEKWDLVNNERKRPLEVGETWYMVASEWWKRWKKACTGEVDKAGPVSEQDLGPVDNATLIDTYGNLRLSLLEGVDIEFVPEETWQHFVDWCVTST